ncbi:MAG: NUDIX domain-containing protein [Candidatus Diapherotrites archaeon]|uniref:NUDIX domain-containing protein n=1 Tax=Candidatus Iainarchaeum sp. TaxID=3101447 RepID=A0A7J4KZG2_9ARCH|nr:NUDIX domain-containing protein [Candidatus Diapherotrites archaeon]HIH21204.1 NUDIX domain-containing protein [Candidatus Diapherotrites archaeon]HIH32736.1 NUDIX domain-containing protein [Candidatus Diapherotrites archaeon]
MTEQKFPEPTCGALIFNKEDKIFLMKSHKWKNKYVIPGGHVELGEKIEDALKREVKEETDLDVFNAVFICFQEFVYDPIFWKKKHFIFFDFACKTNSTKVQLNSEGQDFVWVTIQEALSLPVEPYTMKTIKEFIKKFPSGF